MLHKNRQFVTYIEKYSRTKVIKEIDQLILSLRLRKKTSDVSPESFKLFSYVEIDTEYQRHAPFI